MKIPLFTMDGKRVAEVESPALELMFRNGSPPEILLWGSRFFYRDVHGLYTEGLCWVIAGNDKVTT